MWEYWGYCGEIESLDLMRFPDTGRFKGICFITFKTVSSTSTHTCSQTPRDSLAEPAAPPVSALSISMSSRPAGIRILTALAEASLERDANVSSTDGRPVEARHCWRRAGREVVGR